MMSAKVYAIIGLVVSLGIIHAQFRNSKTLPFIKTISLVCYGNPDKVVNISCKLKPINWEKTLANVDSYLVSTVTNVTLRIELFKFTNQFRPFLLNVTVNLCDMFDVGKGGAYARTLVKFISQQTSLNHSCPYSGHLFGRDVYLDYKLFQFVVPYGKYKIIFVFYDGWPYVHIGTVEAIGLISEGGRVKNGTNRTNQTRTKSA